MRPGRTPLPRLTRRAVAVRLTGLAAALGFGAGPAAAGTIQPVATLDPDLRDAALRGLALASHRGDPILAAAAEVAIARLAETDPEGALLAHLYRLLDMRPAHYWRTDVSEAAVADLAVLHDAILACQPVGFGYTDLGGAETTRSVLPLALVHPPQGVKLLAWCEEREDFRQFFVRAMRGLAPRPGNFGAHRVALLERLLQKESGQT